MQVKITPPGHNLSRWMYHYFFFKEKMNKGLLLVFDGIDGCGKTTAIDGVYDYLRYMNLPAVKGGVIGTGSGIGKAIRAEMFSGKIKPSPELEALCMMTCIKDSYDNFVKPNLEEGNIVLLDRSYTTYLAYQVHTRGINFCKDMITNFMLNNDTPRPDIHFILSVDQEVSERRLSQRNDNKNYLDSEKQETRAKMIEGFNYVISGMYNDYINKKTIIGVDANKDQTSVLQQITEELEKSEAFVKYINKRNPVIN